MDSANLATFIALAGDIIVAIDRFSTLAGHIFPLQSRLIFHPPAPIAPASPELPSVG
jgi:hypothetical protein